MTGHTIAHYKLSEKIGAGGMGDVYRATDSKLHRDVAIKVIAPAFARDPERMARFEREAQVLASLTHGSIAAVHGIEEFDGGKALVMELVEGEDLSERLKRGPLPLNEALRTAVQIAEALEAAHDRGVIHRDLKPGNIKLLESGGIKLLDFGLAKALEDAGSSYRTRDDAATLSVASTRAGLVLGTAAYMSPEQATGSPADRRSDVWSFGVVLFEMLTGQRLFEGQTTSHVLADVIRAEIDFSRLPGNTPLELRTVLERTLERDPRRRLRDIHDARIVLERLLERGTATHSVVRTAPPAALPSSSARKWSLSRLVPIAGMIAALALAAAGWMRPLPIPFQLRMSARLADTVFFPSAPGPAFDLSPDGTRIALVVGTGPVRLLVRRLNELDSTTLVESGADTRSIPYNPFVSPDGGWIGYAVQGELRKVPTTGGTPLTICQVKLSRGASWSSDGTIVFAPSPESGLSRVSAAGGEPQPLTTLNTEANEVTHRWPQVLPGGQAVLFTSHTSQSGFDDASIEVVRLDTGERHVVYKGGAYGRYVPSGHLVVGRNTSLLALPFDVKRLAVTGPAAPIVQNVTTSPGAGAAHFAFASTGLMTYLPAAPTLPVHPAVWVDRAGRVSPLIEEPGTYVHPRLSPDGKQLSLSVYRNGNWDIWVYDIDRGVSTRLTFDDRMETDQVWSRDGREIIYGSEETNGPVTVLRKPADGSGAAVAILAGRFYPYALSPDGRTLAVVGGSTSNDVGLVPLGQENPAPTWILNSSFSESDPAFSPDGRWLAYTSNESGTFEVYVRQFPSGTGRWQISNGGGGQPRWGQNGRELFYRSDEGVMAVDIQASGESLRTGSPRILFRGQFAGGVRGVTVPSYIFSDYDVSPDSSRFVMFPKPNDTDAGTAGMLTLVSNWFDDLARATTPR